MKIYTKGGDKGSTSLVGGFRVSKTHIRIEAYGTLDELNAQLGLLIALLPIGDTTEMLEHIQHMLFTIGCNLATDLSQNALPIEGEVTEKEVALLEKEIDKMQKGEFYSVSDDYDDKFYIPVWLALFLLLIEYFMLRRKNKRLSRINIFEKK